MVDVQSTTKSQVLNRETLDAIPTGRTIQGMGQLITGVSLNIPDVGGSRAMQQTYMSAHGMSASQTTVQVDGLMVNGLDGDGAVQNYFNSSMSQEMVYTTSGAAADVSGGGVRLNMIPKDGGNVFNGSFFAGYQDKSFQTDNLTDELIARGLRSADGIDKLSNFEASLGGPIKKDRIWFFLSARTFHLDTLPADAFNADGSPGRRSAEHQQRAGAHHLADQPEEQVVGLQRSHRQEPRRGDDRRFRSGDGVRRLEFADLHDRVREAHLDADQPTPARRWLLHQLRALQLLLPARHREAARHPGVVHDDQQAGHRAGHDLQRRGQPAVAVSGPALVGWRHCLTSPARTTSRSASRTAGATTAAPTSPTATSARSSPTACPPESMILNTPLGTARPAAQGHRHLRAGRVDAEAADGELRRPLGVLRPRDSARDGAGRPLHRQPVRSARSRCRPGRASRRALARSTTSSAIRRPHSSSASASTCRRDPRASPRPTTRSL